MSYHFPPDLPVGGLRPAKLAKHLPAFGWEPHVLTVGDESLRRTARGEIEPARLHAVKPWPHLPDLLIKARRSLRRFARNRQESAGEEAPPTGGDSSAGKEASLLKRLAVSLLWLPDSNAGWVAPAFFAARRVLRESGIGWVFTTSPPHSVQLVGLLLKLTSGVRWVADFRDPWGLALALKGRETRTELSDRLERALERAVLRAADVVVFNTDRAAEAYRRSFGDALGAKFVAVPNGYDLEDFEGLRGQDKFARFTLSYLGELYLGRSPDTVFLALGELIADGRVDGRDVELRFAGACEEADGVPLPELAARCGVSECLSLSGWVDRGEALRIMARSHLLLLFAPDQPYQVPAKTYDYLAAGNPILLLAREGATRDVVAAAGAGWCVAADDVEGLKLAILQEYDRWREGGEGARYTVQGDPPARYDRRSLTGSLAAALRGTP